MKRLISILFILFLAGCINQNTEPRCNVSPLHDLLTQAADSVYQIHTITIYKFKGVKDSKEQQKEIQGMAFAINKRQLITAAHLVSIDEYSISTHFRYITIYISAEDKTKEEIWLLLDNDSRISAKVIYKDTKLDFAILEVEDDMLFPVYSTGNSDDFHILDRVFTISDFGTGKIIRSGHIMSLNVFKYMESYKERKYDENVFGLYLPIRLGDSGSPVLLNYNGHLKIVGVVIRGVVDGPGMGYAVKINTIVDRFRTWQNEREL